MTYRVLLVRLPPQGRANLASLLPNGGSLAGEAELPQVVRVTANARSAEETASRLRAGGAVVVVLGEPTGGPSAFCPHHGGRMAARSCITCGGPVCTTCRDGAGGEDVCPPCWRRNRSPVRRMRQRQLFVLFLFAVFLFEVWRWREADREATDPTGVVHVGLFQFVDPMYTHASIVRYLNGLSQGGPRTRLVDLAPWWDEERTRYGGHGQYLRLEIFGPWGKEVDLPPLPRQEDPFWLRPVHAWRQVRALANAARERGIDPDNLAVRVFVLYEREAGDTAAHSRGSEKGRVAITRVSLVEKNPAYALVSIAHELAHTLGARDLYTEPDYLAQHPEGFVEPLRDPLYPQRFAELMAVDLPVAPGKEREVVSLDEVRVGHQTAADMGWISQERARLFYAPTSLDAIDRLPGMERRAEHPPVGPPEVIVEQASPAGDLAVPVEELAPPAAD